MLCTLSRKFSHDNDNRDISKNFSGIQKITQEANYCSLREKIRSNVRTDVWLQMQKAVIL